MTERCPLCGCEYKVLVSETSFGKSTDVTRCSNCPLPVELWPAVQALKDRVAELRKEYDKAMEELHYEQKRRRDDEGVWLMTRDANIRATEEIARLKAELAAVKDELEYGKKLTDALRNPRPIVPSIERDDPEYFM